MLHVARRIFGSAALPIKKCKVGLIGGNGGIGRHLALKLKLNKYVTDISLWDVIDPMGVCADLSHIDTKIKMTSHTGDQKSLIQALKASDIVVIVAGVSHSEKIQTREAMFNANAELMVKFTKAIACACPDKLPFIHIVTNPVNALVPICCEYLKEIGCYDRRKVSGSTSVDTMRARTFLGQLRHYDPTEIHLPVVGGHSAGSITPLPSQTQPDLKLSLQERKDLSERIINGASEVVEAKKGKGAAQLSMGHCVERFCNSVCRAICDEKEIVEVGYVPANVNDLEYFACYFTLDENGIKKCHELPNLSPLEAKRYCEAMKDVQKSIHLGKKYVQQYLKNGKEND